jgi:murein DD-endopeptidase MepM/ murein hydrolase activator NlpD
LKRFYRNLFLVLVCLLPLATFAQEPTAEVPAGLTIHVVQRGETLFHIALAYNTTLDYLTQVNSLTNASSLQVGQRLLVPTENSATPAPQIHTVRAGETLNSIATLYNVLLADLQTWNNLANPNQIYAGQVLTIYNAPPAVVTPAANTAAATTLTSNLHTVASGETLFRIATTYGVTVNDLVIANGLSDPTRIFAGQQLIIPTISGADNLIALELPAPLTNLAIKPLAFTEGETGSIQLTTSSAATITGTFLEQALRVIAQENDTRHVMLIGIPVGTVAGVYPVNLQITSGAQRTPYTFNVQVRSGGYPLQNITVSAELAPLLSEAPQKYELDLLQRITSNFTAERLYAAPFGLPAAAAMNSPFGIRRNYNSGAYIGYHTGADFASAPGTPVVAAAAGRVALADLLNIRGYSVVLDHGWGVFTVYSHLSELRVAVGDTVEVGQIIGAAGATGRITGPHLHWEVWVNGVAVNPLQWLGESFP